MTRNQASGFEREQVDSKESKWIRKKAGGFERKQDTYTLNPHVEVVNSDGYHKKN